MTRLLPFPALRVPLRGLLQISDRLPFVTAFTSEAHDRGTHLPRA